MGIVYCPNCGQPMRKTSMLETPSKGNRIILCVCSPDLDSLLLKMDAKIAELEAVEANTGGDKNS